MANNKKDSPPTGQLILGLIDGSLDISRELSNSLSSSMKESRLSRYQIAARISELVGREITKTQLDHWAGESHDGHRMPSDLIPAFCIATGSDNVMDVLASYCNGAFASGKDARYLELAKTQVSRNRLDEKIEALEKELL